MTDPAAAARPPRRHDLDWLRVLAIVLLVFFHAAMPFVDEWGWHLKNAETSSLLLEANFFMSRWRMALLFLVSGAGTAFALGGRGCRQFLRERGRRLLVPLLFGILVIVPPQVYAERLAQGVEYDGYLDFWSGVLTSGAYPRGDLSWHHLWFMAYLVLYTLLLLPLLLRLRGAARARVSASLEAVVGRVGLLPLCAPMIAAVVLLHPFFPGPQDVVHDLAMFTYYLAYFLYGYVLAGSPALWAAIETRRGTSLRAALLCLLAVDFLRWNDLDPGVEWSVAGAAYGALLALHAWAWVLAILGYARRHLSRGGRLLGWANEAALPVYVLHQTVIVVIARYVLPLDDGPMAKFLFLSLVSLAVTVGIYETLVRPFDVARVLFGLRPRLAAQAASPPPHAAPPGAGAARPVPT